MYLDVAGVRDGGAFAALPEGRTPLSNAAIFVSATMAQRMERLDATHWRQWLTSPVDFRPPARLPVAMCLSPRVAVVGETLAVSEFLVR